LLARAVATKVAEALDLPRQKPENLVQTGDVRLLAFDMSEAASKYGVPADVVPKRIRMAPEVGANA